MLPDATPEAIHSDLVVGISLTGEGGATAFSRTDV